MTGQKKIHMNGIDVLVRKPRPWNPGTALFGGDEAGRALRFHRSMPMYEPTRLVSFASSAKKHGVKGIYVKDESARFGLNAFKGLGGSYAMFRILCRELGLDTDCADFRDFLTPENRKRCAGCHFATATDGNHGRGVAWASKQFGCRSTVYLPAGSAEWRRKAIEDAGADEAVITACNYDGTVAHAAKMAEENGWMLIQDTSWESYTEYPEWIIDGYLTMGKEIVGQLSGTFPTHVFLQAGVGSMAGGIMEYLLGRYRENPPVFIIAEATESACIYASALAGDGKAHTIDGHSDTIMAGLNCGTPCSIVWPILRDYASFYCACPDDVAVEGMDAYANPHGDDTAVSSGESGAVTYGLFNRIAGDDELRDMFGITGESVVLLINTEGRHQG